MSQRYVIAGQAYRVIDFERAPSAAWHNLQRVAASAGIDEIVIGPGTTFEAFADQVTARLIETRRERELVAALLLPANIPTARWTLGRFWGEVRRIESASTVEDDAVIAMVLGVFIALAYRHEFDRAKEGGGDDGAA